MVTCALGRRPLFSQISIIFAGSRLMCSMGVRPEKICEIGDKRAAAVLGRATYQ